MTFGWRDSKQTIINGGRESLLSNSFFTETLSQCLVIDAETCALFLWVKKKKRI